MTDTVFDYFEETPYTFLEVSRGDVYGNTIKDTYDATGVFKLRSGMVQVNNQESRQSDSTLHIHPDESFIAAVTVDGKVELVGHGIRRNSVDYEIIGATEGFNFDENVLEHYRLTLQQSDFVEETS